MNDKIDPSARRQERIRRTRSIRRRVIGGAVALFVAAWLMIAVVLVSGRDPALASRSATTSTRSRTDHDSDHDPVLGQPAKLVRLGSSSSSRARRSGSGSVVTRSS